MQLVGYFRDVNPGVHFDLETVRRVAEYGLCDCDFCISLAWLENGKEAAEKYLFSGRSDTNPLVS